MKKIVPLIALCLLSFYTTAQAQQLPEPAPLPSTLPPRGEKPVSTRSTITLPPEKAQPVRIPRVEKAPVIDGKIDEAWESAVVLKDFYQIRPGDNSQPTQKTEVRLCYDNKNLYISFRALDEPGKVRATVAKRDAVASDDNVGIFLDTYNDHRKAYILIFNPLGIQQDGVYTEGRGSDFSVDILMTSKGEVNETGYVVEVAIPFKSLRYEAGKDKFWGIHFFREIKRLNNEIDSWMPYSREQSSILNQSGRLTGLEGLSTERTLEIIPSLTISETGKRVRTIPSSVLRQNPRLIDPGHFVNEPITLDPGLTMKYGITPTVTLDLALNPDFAQVEADQPVVTANQRFPIFFDEKRPFFLEGIDIFRTRLNAVHTRAIIDPDVAVKLTGKVGRNSFGLLLASDNGPGNFSQEEKNDPDILPRIQRFVDKNSYIGVLRLKRDIGKENTIGFLATSSNFIERHNDLGSFDGRFRLSKDTVFDFQVVGTTSRRFFFDSDLGRSIYRTGNAFGYGFSVRKSGRNFGYELSGVGRTRDYRADVGFTRRTNTNNEELFVRYNSNPKPEATLISWRITNSLDASFDWKARMQDWGNTTSFIFNFKRQTSLVIGLKGGYERVFEEEFGQKRTLTRRGTFAGDDPERSAYEKTIFVTGSTTPSQKYSFSFLALYGHGLLDFDFGAGFRYPRVSPGALVNSRALLDPGPGTAFQLQTIVTHQPIAALRTSLSYTKSRLTRIDTGRVAFDDNLFILRSTYQFTRFVFARARIDYSTLSTTARGQFLVGWNPNPGTAFFVGYNDDLSINGFSPFTSNLEPGFRRNGRTFYIKMSYLFQRSF